MDILPSHYDTTIGLVASECVWHYYCADKRSRPAPAGRVLGIAVDGKLPAALSLARRILPPGISPQHEFQRISDFTRLRAVNRRAGFSGALARRRCRRISGSPTPPCERVANSRLEPGRDFILESIFPRICHAGTTVQETRICGHQSRAHARNRQRRGYRTQAGL